MAIDTFIAYSGVYANVDDALADYDAVHALSSELGLIDAYDAAVVERKADGKVKIVKKHETPDSRRRCARRWRRAGDRARDRVVPGRRDRWRAAPRDRRRRRGAWAQWPVTPRRG